MSVKLKTTEQLHKDLNSIHNMWPGGIPNEQIDQLNSLKAELKRRGSIASEARPELPQPRRADELSAEALTKELQALGERISKNPNDEELQNRFADVRFELRKALTNAEPKRVAAFNPVTGQTDLAEAARAVQPWNPGQPDGPTTNGNGHGQVAQSSQQAALLKEMKADFDATESARLEASWDRRAKAREEILEVQAMQQQVMRVNIAKVAASIAGSLLAREDAHDLNGDDIEAACSIAVQAAQSIFTKVGL